MREAKLLFGEQGAPMPHFYFVSIDPERDTSVRLTDYTAYFDADFVGFAATLDSLSQLSGQLGVGHMKVEKAGGAGYLREHTASVYLINSEGRFQALFAPPHDPSIIAAEYATIVERHE